MYEYIYPKISSELDNDDASNVIPQWTHKNHIYEGRISKLIRIIDYSICRLG